MGSPKNSKTANTNKVVAGKATAEGTEGKTKTAVSEEVKAETKKILDGYAQAIEDSQIEGVVTLLNICGYPKNDTESSITFKPNVPVKGVEMNAWMRAQVKARILAVVK